LPAALGAALALVASGIGLGAAPRTADAAYCYYPAVTGGQRSFWTPDLGSGGFYESAIFSRSLGVYRDNFSFDFGGPAINTTGYSNPKDFGCHSEEHGQEWAMAPEEIDGIRVTPKSYADPRRPFGRSYVTLKNVTGAPVTFDFSFDDSLGSGTDTNVDRTSSGDATANAGDSWATVCDDPDGDGCANTSGEASRHPEIADGWQRLGKVKDKADSVTLADGSDDANITFGSITLKPEKRVAYMAVASIALNIKTARREATRAAKHAKRYGVFRGLSKGERARLRNW
jgi:hypothetical protein